MAWIRDLLLQHRNNGGIVLLSSHLLRDAQDMCDDLVVLAHGEVQWTGPLTEFGGQRDVTTDFGSERWEEIVRVLDADAEHVPGNLIRVQAAPAASAPPPPSRLPLN